MEGIKNAEGLQTLLIEFFTQWHKWIHERFIFAVGQIFKALVAVIERAVETLRPQNWGLCRDCLDGSKGQGSKHARVCIICPSRMLSFAAEGAAAYSTETAECQLICWGPNNLFVRSELILCGVKLPMPKSGPEGGSFFFRLQFSIFDMLKYSRKCANPSSEPFICAI